MKILIREILKTIGVNIYGTDGKLHTREFFEKYVSFKNVKSDFEYYALVNLALYLECLENDCIINKNIPNDLIEAAKIDGASKSQILRKVTIPLVMPSVTICLFLTISNAFKLFDQNLALTDGAPSGATSMLALDIYKTFYSRNGWEGVGQAKAVIFFIIVAIIMIIQLNITRKKEVES